MPPDPQTRRRDFWGAAVLGVLGAVGGYAASWAGLGHYMPTLTSATGFILDLTSHKLTWANTSQALMLKSGLSLTAAAIAATTLFNLGFRPQERLRHVRGRRYLDGKEAIKQAQKQAKMEIKESGESVPLSQDFKLANDRTKTHALIVGGVGAGKTTIAHHLLKGIFEKGHRALIVDWKGDFTSGYNCQIFNPLDRRSMRWLVALDVVSELDAQAFAGQIIPDPVGSADPFWSNAARSVLTALVIKCQQTKPKKWTWSDLYQEVTAGLPSIQKAVGDYYSHALQNISETGKQTQGVISQIVSQFDGIRVLAQAEEDDPTAQCFSVRDWLSGRHWLSGGLKPQIILGGSTEHERLCRGFMSAVITCAASQLMARQDSSVRKMWLICDEFPKLGKCEAVPKLLAFGRSKGARVVLLAQDLAQLREIYGQDQTKSMVSMVGTIIIGRTAGGETADTLAKQVIGTREVERRNVTTQGNSAASESWQRDELLVVHPSELQTELGKRGDHINALIVGMSDYVLNLPFNFVAPPAFRKPMEWREIFRGVGKPKTTVFDVPLTQPPTDKMTGKTEEKDELGEATIHQVTEAINPFSSFLEGLTMLDTMRTTASTQKAASHSHQGQRLKNENEQEAEKE
jgi:Type IV secretion-system coupling protein DNA-binding domain